MAVTGSANRSFRYFSALTRHILCEGVKVAYIRKSLILMDNDCELFTENVCYAYVVLFVHVLCEE